MPSTRTIFILLLAGALGTFASGASAAPVAQTAPALQLLSAPPRQWARAEFRVDGVPLQGANAFDPDQIALDATITAPSGAALVAPLFWYVGYARSLETVAGQEQEELTPAQNDDAQNGEWRLRWTPRESGPHTVFIAVKRGQETQKLAPMRIVVGAKNAGARGFIAVEPTRKRFFQTEDGKPLPLLGMNLCWPGRRGTYDYDDWLGAMGKNKMNYARLWQGNAGFRAELYGPERTNYNQQTLWQLDYVLDLAARNGVNIMLAMGYHGEFQTTVDMWGNEGWWKTHAYQIAQGGPADKPNDFFTNAEAAKLYRKRLRYMVARYGADTNLLSWQFFNEINNYYGDASQTEQQVRDENLLYPPDVVSWHARMSDSLRALDPYHHLITTSLGSAGEEKELWQLPNMDYVNWHWYGNWGGPYDAVTQMTGAAGAQLSARYDKPVLISEFGTDGRGWNPATDAGRRGLRQAIWGGIFGGTAGTAMPWWWEDIARENLYPLWRSLRDFLPASYGSARWKTIEKVRPTLAPEPLGNAKTGAAPFSQRLALTTQWGKGEGAPFVLNRAGDGDQTQSGFVHGKSKPELREPFLIEANVGEGAQLVMHLNSVANDSVMVVRQNGAEIFRRALPNKDGGWERNNEYNEDIAVPLRAGRARIEISNAGEDWFFLDWVRVDGALTSEPTTTGEVPLEHTILSDGTTRLLWIVDSRYSWPRARTQEATPLENARLTLRNWPNGAWKIEWWQTRAGQPLETAHAQATDGTLELTVPTFSGDVAARLTPGK